MILLCARRLRLVEDVSRAARHCQHPGRHGLGERPPQERSALDLERYGDSGYGVESRWDALKAYSIKRNTIVSTNAEFDDWLPAARYG